MAKPVGGNHGLRDDSGSITAEFAAVVPAIILLLALCLAAVQLVSVQVRLQDAAAVIARVEARGGETGSGGGSASGYAAQLVPGAEIGVTRRDGLACAVVSGSPPTGPFTAIRLEAASCAPAPEY